MEYLVIMEHLTGEVWYHELTDDDERLLEDSVEDLISFLGFDIDHCVFMFTEVEPRLQKI